MNTLAGKAPWVPSYGWWLLVAGVLATGMVTNWLIALGVLVFMMVQVFRPFDFIATTLVVTAGSTFVYYEGGNLTLQLSLLTGAIVLMLASYVIASTGRTFTLRWSPLTAPILAYVAWALINAARGVLMGHPPKSILFELLPVLAIATTFMVANMFQARRDLHLVFVAFMGIAAGSAGLGFWVFSIIHTHTSGIYFNWVPGLMAIFMINLALRSKTVYGALIWAMGSLPFFLHQFLSFRRALWVGCIAGLITIALTFGIRGGRPRWARVGLVLGMLLGVGGVGAVTLELLYGQTDILTASVGRFASIGNTELSMETRSNVIRLIETAGVLKLIAQSPVVGHGLGFTFVIPNPIQGGRMRPQWWMDQNYFLIWVTQGVIGLALYGWLLWRGFLFTVRNARLRQDPWEASWFATTAAMTSFLVLYSVSDWPFYQVGPTFLIAFLYGACIAMAGKGAIHFHWSPTSSIWSRRAERASAEPATDHP